MTKGWQRKRLGDVLEIQNGYAFDSAGFNPTKGMPLIRIRSLKPGTESETHFEGDYDQKYVVKAGDLLIGMDGEFGCYEWKGGPALLNQRVCRLQRFSGELVPRFLFYGVNDYLKAIEDVTGYATVKHLSSKQILAIEFPVPPLAEQQHIVGLLDEAFARIATAIAHTEKNLENVRTIFESHLQSIFTEATKGWRHKTLEEAATTFGRGKSKHRPRNAPHLYGGRYPFIQTGDIRNANHFITEYTQTYSEAGLAQSKLWPKGTICITIAANIAETAILDFDACFPDSVIGVVANPREAEIGFIEYLLQYFKTRLQGLGKGSAQANINLGTFENERFPFPSVTEQKRIIATLDGLRKETSRLETIYKRKLAALETLKKSLLHQAFTGELTGHSRDNTNTPFPIQILGVSTTDLHAGILAMGLQLHEERGKLRHYGHVKAEKISHMVEAHLGIDLGREPVKDAAGPNDYPHLLRTEHRARNANFFDVQRLERGGYRVRKLRGFEQLIERTREKLGARTKEVEQLLELMLPMNTRQAEIFATAYAAWNNLLLDHEQPNDESIADEARENWHPDKLDIPREKFIAAIDWLKKVGVIPAGKGKRVVARRGK